MKFKDIVKIVSDGAAKNAPKLSMAVGVTCGIVALYFAIKETPKYQERVEEAKETKSEEYQITEDQTEIVPAELTLKDYSVIAAKTYWKVAVAESLSIALIIFGYKADMKKQAALLAACTLSETNLKNYKEKVKETFGENKSKKIDDEVKKDYVRNRPVANERVYETGTGKYLCFERMSGRYFRSNYDFINSVLLELDEELLDGRTVPLNDFYEKLNLPTTSIGESEGWHTARKIDFDPTYEGDTNYEPTLIIDLPMEHIALYD